MEMPPPPPPPMSQPGLEEGFRPGGPPNKEIPGLVLCMNVINTITHLLLGGVAFVFLFLLTILNGDRLLNAHIGLTIVGYVLLMSQATLSFNPYTGWANNLRYPQKRMVHWILQVLGSVLAITGCAMGMKMSSNNLGTVHGIVGFVAMLLTVVSLVGGIANLMFQTAMNTKLFKMLHACVGSLAYIIAFTALCLVISESTFLLLLINFALLGTLAMTFVSFFKRNFN